MSTIVALAKIFNQKAFADQFVGGALHMQSLRYFREYRDETGQVRGDAWEGISAIFQPAQLGEVCIRGVRVPGRDLREPITVVHDNPQERIFCAYALHTHHLDGVSRETIMELKRLLMIHQDAHAFGAVVAVVTNLGRFFERVDRAVRLRGRGYRGLMHYFDEKVHHGYFQRPDGFNKRARYANQREYRIRIELPDAWEGPLSLDVGDLSDIVVLTTVEEFNENLSLRLPDGSCA